MLHPDDFDAVVKILRAFVLIATLLYALRIIKLAVDFLSIRLDWL